MADKVFIGKVTEKIFSNGGSIIKLSLSPDDLKKVSSTGWININIQKSTKGNWYGCLDTWQPTGGNAQATPVAQLAKTSDDIDGLPF